MNTLHQDMGFVSLADAIRGDDEGTVCQASSSLKGLASLDPKRTAIAFRKPDLLRQLLEIDNLIDESLVEAACEYKHRESIQALVDFGWPVDRPLRFAGSLLAAVVDDLDLVRFLVEIGANVNARSKLDESALSVAIVRGSMEVVRFLLAKGTSITHGNLLHCAAQRDNQFEGADLVDELAEKGADVNAYRFHNPVASRWRAMFKLPTPLHVACDKENIPVVEALLRHGADPHRMMLEAGNLTDPTPFQKALQINDPVLLSLFTKLGSN